MEAAAGEMVDRRESRSSECHDAALCSVHSEGFEPGAREGAEGFGGVRSGRDWEVVRGGLPGAAVSNEVEGAKSDSAVVTGASLGCASAVSQIAGIVFE